MKDFLPLHILFTSRYTLSLKEVGRSPPADGSPVYAVVGSTPG